MISAIYKHYKVSGIADILVAAGVIAEGSVDQALDIGVLISSMFRPGSVRYGQILDRFYVNGR